MDTSYDTDVYTWSQEQAARLRQVAELRLNTLPDLDWEHVAEEIEALGISLERELGSRYEVVLLHLLKWRFQALNRSAGWQTSIVNQRDAIADLLEENPGLRQKREKAYRKAFPRARRAAAKETGYPIHTFPDLCPFSLSEAEQEGFFPGAIGEFDLAD